VRDWLRAHWRTLVGDALLLAGLASLSHGAGMAWEPAGYMVAGAGLIGLGLLGATGGP